VTESRFAAERRCSPDLGGGGAYTLVNHVAVGSPARGGVVFHMPSRQQRFVAVGSGNSGLAIPEILAELSAP
jgi:hypothetical protein